MVKEYPQVPTVYSSAVETKMLCKKGKSDLKAFKLDKLTAELYKGEQPYSTPVSTIPDKTTVVLKFTTISQIACSCVWSVPLS